MLEKKINIPLVNYYAIYFIVKLSPIIALQTIFHSVVTPSKSKDTIPGEV